MEEQHAYVNESILYDSESMCMSVLKGIKM